MKTKASAILISLIVGLLGLALQLDALQAQPRAGEAETAFTDQRASVKAATYWLITEFQNDDGGYASLSGGANQAPSTIPGTLDAVLAIAAGGYNPAAVFPGQESSPVHYLQSNEAGLTVFAEVNGGQAGKVVLALTASAVDPRDFAGQDYVSILTGHLQPSGAYSVDDPFKQAIAILGVASAGETVPAEAISWLEGKQAADGSWDDGFGTLSNPDTTALALMALLAAGHAPADAAVQAGVDFLASAQLADGWAYGAGLTAGANSTALVIQALSALGEDWYTSSGPWVVEGQTALQALLGFQSASGAFLSDFGQGPFEDFYATVQAIPAAAGRPFPLPARREAARRALVCLDSLQDSASGGWAPFAGSPVDAGGTSRAIQAIAAAGEDPQSARWTVAGGANAAEALESLAPAYLAGGRGGRAGIVMQGVVAAGEPYNPADFAGENLPLLVSGYLSPTGEYDSTAFGIFAHGEAMLGLIKAGEPVDPSAIDFLLSAQTDGDWGDPDSNGIVLQILGGLSRPVWARTLAALHDSQTADGGWGFGADSNPNSTSEVVQGLTSAGQNPFGPNWSRVVDGRLTNAADAILDDQTDNGCWPNLFGPGDDPYSTTDAILLLTQQPGWGFSFANLPIVASRQ